MKTKTIHGASQTSTTDSLASRIFPTTFVAVSATSKTAFPRAVRFGEGVFTVQARLPQEEKARCMTFFCQRLRFLRFFRLFCQISLGAAA